MVRYGIRDLHALLLWVDHTISWTYGRERDNAQELSEVDRSRIHEVRCLAKHCQMLEFPEIMDVCEALLLRIDNVNASEVRGHLISIREPLTKRLDERIFMYVPRACVKFAPPLQKQDRARLDLLLPAGKTQYKMGNNAWRVFCEARYDIEQIAMCMVAGASTAMVFHAMRVVELGVRDLGRDLGIRK
jgi:hypothetical protein